MRRFAVLAAGATAGILAGSIASANSRPNGMPTARQRFQQEWWVKVYPWLKECDALATRRNEFGDLVVEFWPSDDRPVVLSASKQLGADVRRCAVSALRDLARIMKPHLGDVAETGGVAAIGKVRPLLPPPPALLPAWLEATAGGVHQVRARAALRRLLPPDVVVDSNGCLDVAPTPHLGDGIDEWLGGNARPVVPLWLRELRLTEFQEDVAWAYVLAADRSYLISRTYFPRTSLATQTYAFGTLNVRRVVPAAHRLCIARLEGSLLAHLSAEIEANGECWRGTPEELLVAPHFEFPGRRAYRKVRTATDGRACALDAAGALICCGRTKLAIGAGKTFIDFDASPGTVCMVDAQGKASCSSLDDGRETLVLPGVFSHVSSALLRACGVRTDGVAVCSALGIQPPPQVRFRDIDAQTSCGLEVTGAISSWSAGRIGERGFSCLVSDVRAASSVACALDGDGAPWCWDTADAAQQPRREPTAVRFTTIDVTVGARCGIAKTPCGVQCWTSPGAQPIPGNECLTDISLGAPSCGVTKDGRVLCGEHPLWNSATTAPASPRLPPVPPVPN